MRRDARVDSNHAAVTAAFVALGCKCLSLAPLGRGAPDLAVAKDGQTWLVEIKAGPKARTHKETAARQATFAATWPGRLFEVRDELDAARIVGQIQAGK